MLSVFGRSTFYLREAHLATVIASPFQVAWTRAGDNNLLTVGEASFTSDPRFQVSLKTSVSDWVLIIRCVRHSP
jgi:hypothetical protein